MPRNFFVTGQKNSGKSTLIQMLMRERKERWYGFFTLPYEIDGKRRGFYLHSLEPVASGENDLPISVQPDESHCIPCRETFEGLGCQCLKEALRQAQWVVMDELGRLEKEAYAFQNAVEQILDSDIFTICAVKKEKNVFLDRIRGREDAVLFDLDCETTEVVFQTIRKRMIQEDKEL